MIDVLLVTWPNHAKRIAYFRRTLAALTSRLTASRHTLRYLCSAESQRDPQSTWHGDELEALCREHDIALTWRPAGAQASLGAGMNAALRLATAPTLFLVQDDYELLEPLDLSPGAELLVARPAIDLIRYSYFTHPEHGTKFLGALPGAPGFRQVDIHGTWPYGDDPHLRRPDFMDRHGWYVEGGNHGVSEGDMLHRLVRNRAAIAAPDRCYFGHFGEIAAVPLDQEHRPRAVSR